MRSSTKLFRPTQLCFVKVELEWKTIKSCGIHLHFPLFLIELLLQEIHFGHNTHTQMHTSIYL